MPILDNRNRNERAAVKHAALPARRVDPLQDQDSLQIFDLIAKGQLELRPGSSHPAIKLIQRAINRYIMSHPELEIGGRSGLSARITPNAKFDSSTCEALRVIKNHNSIGDSPRFDKASFNLIFPAARPAVHASAANLKISRAYVGYYVANSNGENFSFRCERFNSPAQEARARKPHLPAPFTSDSGLTLVGFDIGSLSKAEVIVGLKSAGIKDLSAWTPFINAAGLKGKIAHDYQMKHSSELEFLSISREQEKRLFRQTYNLFSHEAKRLYDRWCEVKMGSAPHLSWEQLNPRVRSLLIDLRLRGDNTPKARAVLLPLASTGKDTAFLQQMCNEEMWCRTRSVPRERFLHRAEYACAGMIELKKWRRNKD